MRSELRERLCLLNSWRREGEVAPHKPLLVLYALGRWFNERAVKLSFREVNRDLAELLAAFGPHRKSYHPEYPFWRLQNDCVWQVDLPPGVAFRESSDDPKKSELLKYDVKAGFSDEILSDLESEPDVVYEIAQAILNDRFPTSQHQSILKRVGLLPRT